MHLVAVRRFKDLSDILTEYAQAVGEAAGLLQNLLRWRSAAHTCPDLKRLQRRGENLHAELIACLRDRYVLPADREDLLAVSAGLDGALRRISAAGEHIVSLELPFPPPQALELAGIVARCADLLVPAIEGLHTQTGILDHCLELTRLRKQARQRSLALKVGLLEQRIKPALILKWDVICRDLEQAALECETVGNVIQLAVLKVAPWQPASS